MNILKYKKKKNGQYELMLESGEELSLYEDVILNFDLLLKKAINDKDRDKKVTRRHDRHHNIQHFHRGILSENDDCSDHYQHDR